MDSSRHPRIKGGNSYCSSRLPGSPRKVWRWADPSVEESWALRFQTGKCLIRFRKNKIVCLSQEEITPELAQIAPIRRELGLRSLFNTVEKALNPMNVSHLAIGYFHETILPAMESMIRAAHPHAKTTFVGGQEGSVGLFTHRGTKIVQLHSNPDLGMEILPPVDEKVEPITVSPTTEAYTQYYHELIKNPLHPHRKALFWQAATLLLIGELTSQMGEALSLIGDPGKELDW